MSHMPHAPAFGQTVHAVGILSELVKRMHSSAQEERATSKKATQAVQIVHSIQGLQNKGSVEADFNQEWANVMPGLEMLTLCRHVGCQGEPSYQRSLKQTNTMFFQLSPQLPSTWSLELIRRRFGVGGSHLPSWWLEGSQGARGAFKAKAKELAGVLQAVVTL